MQRQALDLKETPGKMPIPPPGVPLPASGASLPASVLDSTLGGVLDLFHLDPGDECKLVPASSTSVSPLGRFPWLFFWLELAPPKGPPFLQLHATSVQSYVGGQGQGLFPCTNPSILGLAHSVVWGSRPWYGGAVGTASRPVWVPWAIYLSMCREEGRH